MDCRSSAQLMAWYDDFYSRVEQEVGRTKCDLVGQAQRAAIDFIAEVTLVAFWPMR